MRKQQEENPPPVVLRLRRIRAERETKKRKLVEKGEIDEHSQVFARRTR